MSPSRDVAVWGDRPAPDEGETDRVQIGPLALWIRRVENEVWLAHHRSAEDEAPPAHLPEDPEWSRWATREGKAQIRLRPVFPDRPLVVKTEYPFTLLPKARARLYTRVPVWVRVEAVDEAKDLVVPLAEIPTMPLSDTWWGDFMEGELAYWLTTKGRRALDEDLFEPHLVMNTLQLTNRSDDDLPVEKLALRVEHLSIFEKAGHLWAEEVRVDYQGEEEGSDIHMDDQAPPEAGDAREISPARVQARSFRARTFRRLKALSGLGG